MRSTDIWIVSLALVKAITKIDIILNIMYIKVFVTPDAKREKVDEEGDTLRISVREPALQNCANTRVREIVANRLGVEVGKVRILTGHRSRVKMISVTIKRTSEE